MTAKVSSYRGQDIYKSADDKSYYCKDEIIVVADTIGEVAEQIDEHIDRIRKEYIEEMK